VVAPDLGGRLRPSSDKLPSGWQASIANAIAPASPAVMIDLGQVDRRNGGRRGPM
jgi:hypothetical protein